MARTFWALLSGACGLGLGFGAVGCSDGTVVRGVPAYGGSTDEGGAATGEAGSSSGPTTRGEGQLGDECDSDARCASGLHCSLAGLGLSCTPQDDGGGLGAAPWTGVECAKPVEGGV